MDHAETALKPVQGAHGVALPTCVTSSFPPTEEALLREVGERSPEVYAALLTASATVESMASLATIGHGNGRTIYVNFKKVVAVHKSRRSSSALQFHGFVAYLASATESNVASWVNHEEFEEDLRYELFSSVVEGLNNSTVLTTVAEQIIAMKKVTNFCMSTNRYCKAATMNMEADGGVRNHRSIEEPPKKRKRGKPSPYENVQKRAKAYDEVKGKDLEELRVLVLDMYPDLKDIGKSYKNNKPWLMRRLMQNMDFKFPEADGGSDVQLSAEVPTGVRGKQKLIYADFEVADGIEFRDAHYLRAAYKRIYGEEYSSGRIRDGYLYSKLTGILAKDRVQEDGTRGWLTVSQVNDIKGGLNEVRISNEYDGAHVLALPSTANRVDLRDEHHGHDDGDNDAVENDDENDDGTIAFQ